MNRHDTHYLSHQRKLARRETVKTWLVAISGSAALLFIGGYLDGREQVASAQYAAAQSAGKTLASFQSQQITITDDGPGTFCTVPNTNISLRCAP